MTVLLDTNVCIAVMNRRPLAVRERLRLASERGESVMLSAISLFELWYGVAKSAHAATNAERLADFLTPLAILPFDDEDARVAGTIRAGLERIGKPIGAYDCLIAGQALRRGLLLVTANVSEYARVEGLHWQDWTA